MAPKPGVQTRARLTRTNTSQPVTCSSSTIRNRPTGVTLSTPSHGISSSESPHDIMSRAFDSKKAELQCHKCKATGKYGTYGSEPNRKLLRLRCTKVQCRSTLSGTKVIQLLNKHGADIPEDLGLATMVPITEPETNPPLTSEDPQPYVQAIDHENPDIEDFTTPRGTQEQSENQIISILKDQIETLKAQNDRQSKQISELTAQIKLLTDLLTSKDPQHNNGSAQTPRAEQTAIPVQTDQVLEIVTNSKEKEPTPAESIAPTQSRNDSTSKDAQKQPAKNPPKEPKKPAMSYIDALSKGSKDSLPNNIAAGIAEATKELEKAGFAPTKAPRRRTTVNATNADGTTAQAKPVVL